MAERVVAVAGAVGGALGAAAGVLEGAARPVTGEMGLARFLARLGGLCARPAVKGEGAGAPTAYAPCPEAPAAETDALVARGGAKASPVSYNSVDRMLSETVRDIARAADAEVQSKDPPAAPAPAADSSAEAEVVPLLPAAEAAPSPAVAPSPEDLVASLSTSPYCPPASPAKPAEVAEAVEAVEAVEAEAAAPAAAADPPKVVHFAAEVVAREEEQEHKTPNVPITSAVSGALSDQFKTPMGELAPTPEALLEEAAASPDLLLAEAPAGAAAAAAVADYLEYAKSASTQVAALMERSTNAVISSVSETLEKQAPVFAKKKSQAPTPQAPTPKQPTPSVFLTQKSAKALAKEARRAKKKHRGRTRAAHGVKKTVRAVR